jgi:hypothetical protein
MTYPYLEDVTPHEFKPLLRYMKHVSVDMIKNWTSYKHEMVFMELVPEKLKLLMKIYYDTVIFKILHHTSYNPFYTIYTYERDQIMKEVLRELEIEIYNPKWNIYKLLVSETTREGFIDL